MSEGKLWSVSLWAQSSPFTVTGMMLPVPSMGGAGSKLVGGWLPCLSHGAWEDVANFQVILSVLGSPLTLPPVSAGLQGTQGLQGEYGGGDMCSAPRVGAV